MVATTPTAVKMWIYDKSGNGTLCDTREEAQSLIASGEYSDHPNGIFAKIEPIKDAQNCADGTCGSMLCSKCVEQNRVDGLAPIDIKPEQVEKPKKARKKKD